MVCVICCNNVSLEDVSESEKGLQMCCRHIYHESCIREWLNYVRECPLCRRYIAFGRDIPIRIEDTNTPSHNLLEVHKQLWLLQELFVRNKQVEFVLERMQRRHRTEIEKWVVTRSDAWSMEENLVKTVLVGNFITDIEFKQYRDYYTENIYEFLLRCASTLLDDDDDDDVPDLSTLLPNENRL